MKHSAAKVFTLGVVVVLASASVIPAAGASEVYVLQSSPACIEQNLGSVQVTLGEERPDPRRGGIVLGVSYKKAFDKLKDAAVKRGGNAVVLREHRADYFTIGARRAPRPTYVALSGTVIRIHDPADSCSLARIDPVKFAREAMAKKRTNVAKNAGVNF